ncbi:MAG: hypothetical protein U5R31_16785 [Acidimicrobiia bacterium]|nr:hypothetical protein [Acidimicrobiia bacterium]
MTTQPTLEADPVADPDGDDVTYWFKVWTVDQLDPEGQVVDSGWLEDPRVVAAAGGAGRRRPLFVVGVGYRRCRVGDDPDRLPALHRPARPRRRDRPDGSGERGSRHRQRHLGHRRAVVPHRRG